MEGEWEGLKSGSIGPKSDSGGRKSVGAKSHFVYLESAKVELSDHEECPTPALTPLEARDAKFPRELDKMIVAFVFFMVAVVSNAVTLSINHDIVGRHAIPDLTHTIFPQRDWMLRFGDYVVIATVILNGLNCFFHRHRWIIARRSFAIVGVIFLFRDVLMTVTGMPPAFFDAQLQCRAPNNNTDFALVMDRVKEQLLFFGLQDGTNNGYLCGDMMFSGHTAFLVIGCFLFCHYSDERLWLLHYFVRVVTFFGILAMVVSRAHYSIDILISYWVSVGFFSIYHAFTEVPRTVRERSSFRRMWWFWALLWLEEGCPAGRVPNTIEWPFPWPKLFKDKLRALNRPRESDADE